MFKTVNFGAISVIITVKHFVVESLRVFKEIDKQIKGRTN